MLVLVKVREGTATSPSEKTGESFEVWIHFMCSDQLMRKPPHAREGLALALSPGLILGSVSVVLPVAKSSSPTRWCKPSWLPGAPRSEEQHNKFYICHHLETKHLSICRAHFCTVFLLQLENIMYASHLATSILSQCHQTKLPCLNNVLNTKEHKPSYMRIFSFL